MTMYKNISLDNIRNKYSSIKLTVIFNTVYESVFNNVNRSPLDKEREFL